MSFKEQPFFHYELLDLSQSSFRLCKLLPGIPGDPVQCELTHELTDALKGQYSALSYTWGELSEIRWIRLNTKPFHVQSNLLAALKAIRKPNESLTLWADAVCINQLDVLERGHQVSLMGKVYANAARVLAWLGSESDNSDLAFDYLNGMGDEPRDDEKLSEEHEQDSPKVSTNAGGKEQGRSREMPKDAFRALSQRDYWQRAWIKQEIILAKDIFVYCGTKSTDGFSFSWWATLASINDIELRWESRFVMELFMHQADLRNGKSKTLEELLQKYNRSQCADFRDRAFALLALASDCAGLERKMVDYTLDRPLLFFALMAHIQPAEPRKLGAILQEAFRVRKTELIKVWDKVSESPCGYIQSHDLPYMQRTAEEYIRQVQEYGKSGLISQDMDYLIEARTKQLDDSSFACPSHIPRFIALSYLAQIYNEIDLNSGNDLNSVVYFPIEGLDIVLIQKSTLFGYVFGGTAQKTPSGGWETFPHSRDNDEQASICWSYAELLLNIEGECLWTKELDDVKKVIIEQHGLAALNPDANTLSLVLTALNAQRDLCMTDCRYLITQVYGRKILDLQAFRLESARAAEGTSE